MLEFILGLVVGGPAGWFGRQFVGDPWTRLRQLREETRIALEQSFNASEGGILHPRELSANAKRVRAVGIEIGAFEETSWPPTRWWFRCLGYDLPKAKAALIAFANALPSRGGSLGASRYDAEKALKLAMSYTERPTIRDKSGGGT